MRRYPRRIINQVAYLAIISCTNTNVRPVPSPMSVGTATHVPSPARLAKKFPLPLLSCPPLTFAPSSQHLVHCSFERRRQSLQHIMSYRISQTRTWTGPGHIFSYNLYSLWPINKFLFAYYAEVGTKSVIAL
jgi:hypothetical protein